MSNAQNLQLSKKENTATFKANSRHLVQVCFNGSSGYCDVLVTDETNDKTFQKPLALCEYNLLIDWLTENDHPFAMNSIHSFGS